VKKGLLDVGALYEPPFKQLAPKGPEELFTESDIDTLESVFGQVRATAIPHQEAV
jgi:type I restriction enzyme R subunit